MGSVRYALIPALLFLFQFVAFAQGPWPTFGENPQHTGLSPFVGPQAPDTRWTYAPALGYFYGLVVGPNETIYASAPGSLYAIDGEGSLKWKFATYPAASYGSPAVAADGTIYIGIDDGTSGTLCAINPDGTLKWRSLIGSALSKSSPVVSSDGTIYVGTLSGDVVAFMSNGGRKWRFSIGGQVLSSPAMGFDGTIYVKSYMLPVSSLNGLYAIGPEGVLKWRFAMNPTATSPTIAADGTIYATDNTTLYAVNSNGTLKWSYVQPAQLLTSPAVGSDGTVYVGSTNRILSAFDSSGTLLWHFTSLVQSGGMNIEPPVIGADGVIYTTGPTGIVNGVFGLETRNLVFAINRDGSLKWVTRVGFTTASQPILGAKGLYVSAIFGREFEEGLLYAFGTSGPAPAVPRLPTLTSINPLSLNQGQVWNVTLVGANFAQGATGVNVSGSGISVDVPIVQTSEMLTVNLKVDSDAAPGARAVSVTTKGGTTDAVSLLIGCITPCGAPPPKRAIQAFRVNSPGGGMFSTLGAAAEIASGYATLESVPGNVNPAGAEVLQYRADVSNGLYGPASILISEAAISASRPITSGRLQRELTSSTTTALALVNSRATVATLTFNFTDESGREYGNGQLVIQPFQQVSAYLNQQPFNGGISSNGAFTFFSTTPVFAAALQFVANARGEVLMVSVPIFDLSVAPKMETAVLPQFVDGGGWSSTVVLANPTTATLTGTIQFRDASGLSVGITSGGQRQSTFSYSIPGKGSFRLATSGVGSDINSGSVIVTPVGGSTTPLASATVAEQSGGATVSATTMTSMASSAFRIFVELSGPDRRVRTALAIANPSASAVLAKLDLFNLDGVSVQSRNLMISAFGRVAQFLDELFSQLAREKFQGVLRVSSGQSSVALAGFRTTLNERGDFLITSIAPFDETSSPIDAPIAFPQIVDGFGYTTEFILWNGSDSPLSGYLTTFSRSEIDLHPLKP